MEDRRRDFIGSLLTAPFDFIDKICKFITRVAVIIVSVIAITVISCGVYVSFYQPHCKSCNSIVERGSTYCSHCGSQLNDSTIYKGLFSVIKNKN